MTEEETIVDWQNVVDDEGREIECTTANKLKLLSDAPGLVEYLELAAAGGAHRERSQTRRRRRRRR